MTDQSEQDSVFMIEDIDPESWHVREVYAKFGLAMYRGQVLEHEIVNLIVWSGVNTGTYTNHQEFDTANIEMFRKTMGELKRVLMTRRIDLNQLEDELVKTVRLRNFLAHSYFRERAAAFMSENGRDEMISELDRAVEFFEQVDTQLTSFTNKILESFGVLGKIPEIMEQTKETRGFGEPLPGLS
jgi:hypothetical protein